MLLQQWPRYDLEAFITRHGLDEPKGFLERVVGLEPWLDYSRRWTLPLLPVLCSYETHHKGCQYAEQEVLTTLLTDLMQQP